jgi:hypothetical protein
MKKALTTVVAAGALVAVAVPTANARMWAGQQETKAAKHVTTVAKAKSSARVLCICIVGPPEPYAQTQLAFEQQANQEAIDHGFPAPYDLSDTGATS